MRLLKLFRRDERGVTALMFGLAFLPTIGLTGAAVDYSRATKVKARIQTALDTAVLAATRDGQTLTDAQLKDRARKFVEANVTADSNVTITSFDLVRSGKVIRATATASVRTALMNLMGHDYIDVAGESHATFGTNKIEIALVLDNTGSMSWSNKMTELKRALCGDTSCSNTSPTSGFVKIMKDAAATTGRIMVGIVPFDTTVRMPQAVQDSVRAASPVDTSFNHVNSGIAYCSSGHVTNDAKRVNWFRFANKDKDTTASRYDEDGKNVGTGCGTGRTKNTDWNGCVWDRDTPSNRDTTDGDITGTDTTSLHPAVNCRNNNLARIRPLADIWTESGQMITHMSTMQPSGNTNLKIGVSWGMALLDKAEPFTEAEPDSTPNVHRFMILMTDGDNTESRDSTSGGAMDVRTLQACSTAKARGITVYSIRVIEGNATMLRDCATSSSHYFNVTNASQLGPVFEAIANQIGSIRLTH